MYIPPVFTAEQDFVSQETPTCLLLNVRMHVSVCLYMYVSGAIKRPPREP